MAKREVNAVFEAGEVVVSSQEDAEMLLQSGYGTRRDDQSALLSDCDVLYLVAESRLQVVESTDMTELSFRALLGKFREKDPEIWTRYLVFRDLRSRGYVVKDGVGWGVDFRVYERGKYGKKTAKYAVFALCEGDPLAASQLREILRLVHGMKKEMIVAVMDRRGEIVYYSLSRLNLHLRAKRSA